MARDTRRALVIAASCTSTDVRAQIMAALLTRFKLSLSEHCTEASMAPVRRPSLRVVARTLKAVCRWSTFSSARRRMSASWSSRRSSDWQHQLSHG
jgi:hypothetical protein